MERRVNLWYRSGLYRTALRGGNDPGGGAGPGVRQEVAGAEGTLTSMVVTDCFEAASAPSTVSATSPLA